MYKDRRLIEYLPEIVRENREYKAILDRGEQEEIYTLWDKVYQILADEFVMDATEAGIERYEKIYGIEPPATYSLDDRRFTILTKINKQYPFTIRTLDNTLKNLCGEGGYYLELQSEIYTLIVKVALVALNNYEEVAKMLQEIVPANIVINQSIIYNTHKVLSVLQHSDLKRYTHQSIRGEVIT